jgi:hypothetical protein
VRQKQRRHARVPVAQREGQRVHAVLVAAPHQAGDGVQRRRPLAPLLAHSWEDGGGGTRVVSRLPYPRVNPASTQPPKPALQLKCNPPSQPAL